MYIQNPEQFVKQNPIEKLSLEKAKEIYDKLVDDLNYHNYLYYVKSQPIISDYEYDLLFHYLEDLEKKFPQLIRKDSPTQRLTNQIQDQLKKAEHKYPLLSLENTYDPDEVAEKLEKIENDIKNSSKIPDNTKISFYVEPKYDGLSIELIYERGFFKQAITRGDGFVGEDVTENAKTIKTLPLRIPYRGKLHIRGEVVVKKTIFEKINKEREKQGLETYSNPRNLASGSLRQLDPSITRQRQLDVVCYEVLNFKEINLSYHHESLDFLEKNGFWVFDFKTLGVFDKRQGLGKKKILEIVKSGYIKNLLDEQDIEFDGLVIKVDEEKYWPILGSTAHHPKWAFAFKYPAKQVSTKLLDVELSVGRTGIITPVAILQPVEIDGVIVKRATLHNFDFIKEKNIYIQDYVWVKRSGEVIPYIEGVIKERRQSDNIEHLACAEQIKRYINSLKNEEIEYQNSYLEYILKYNLCKKNIIEYGYLVKILEPAYCPVCGGETFHPEEEVALRCINVSCPAQIREKLSYFVSKNGLDIEGLSEKTIELLLKVGLIKTFADIFKLPKKRQELLALPGFKEKKVENIIKSIEEKKEVSLERFLQALGIEFVGKKTVKLIVENLILLDNWKDFLDGEYVNFVKLMDFLTSDKGYNFLLSIPGIGLKVAESIKKFFNEKHNQEVILELLKYVKIKVSKISKGKFKGKTFVITGSVEGVPRDKIASFIEENGGEFSNQVSHETTLLLVGEKPGKSKLDKAKKYGIPTYDLYRFLKENGFSFPGNVKIQESLF